MATPNYSIPEFSPTGSVDLIGVYNAAMRIVDAKLKGIETKVDTVSANLSNVNGFAPNSSTDKPLTVANLNGAKVTSAGIIYFKQ